MTEQNGIDILCDAAGSDLLLSSLFHPSGSGRAGNPPSASLATGAVQGLTQAQVQAEEEEEKSRAKRVKTDATPSSSTGASHVCHLCRRLYERADHLTRHMRSHENARQHQCSRCQKRFNRADLLTRHETTHDRDTNGKKGRPIVRLRDRAAEACHNCAASKAKCDDQKPCSRCRNRGLPCETTPKKLLPDQRPSSNVNSTPSPSFMDPSAMTPDMRSGSYAIPSGYGFASDLHSSGKSASHAGVAINDTHNNQQNDSMLHQSMLDGIPNELMEFNPANNFFPDVDFTSWDLNFEGFAVPPFDSSHGTSPHSSVNTTAKPAGRVYKDTARRHAAFKKSPWLWEPEQTDYVRRDTEGLQLNEDAFSHSLPFGRSQALGRPANRLKLTTATRDRLFAIVLATINDPTRVTSFPSLEILNYLLHVHFLNDEYQCDSWVHAASFNPDQALPELLAAMIAHGASFISVPSVWQFGLALQEIVRQRIGTLFETKNSNTRRLECLQAYMQNLDVGIWSGFKRKTELAESFLQPMITMTRRAGVFTPPADSPSIIPLGSDSAEVLEAKWHTFITRESWKRLVLHIFFHDVQTSISLQKNVLMSFTELSFCLPAAQDLWKAPSAEAWRDAYLTKQHIATDHNMPRIAEVMYRLDLLDAFVDMVDLDLCYMTILHGFWSQIAAYREGMRFYYNRGSEPGSRNNPRNSTRRLLLGSQSQELYRDLNEFSAIICPTGAGTGHGTGHGTGTGTGKPQTVKLAILAELLMMILHVSLDDLQSFAGKAGEDEARRAAISFEDEWAQSAEARYAVWHAGQVLRNARRLPPTSLTGFYAMAVYLATLTLWMYGLLSCSCSSRPFDGSELQHRYHHHQDDRPALMAESTVVDASLASSSGPSLPVVVLDGEETEDIRAFLQLNRGVPGLTVVRDVQHQYPQQHQQPRHVEVGRIGVEALSNPGMALAVGRNIFRDNFPDTSEPLPPLVNSLVSLLRDLGSGPAGRASREMSESS